MGTKVLIPVQLQEFTKKKSSVFIHGKTVGELLKRLSTLYPKLRRKLFNPEGRLQRQFHVLLNDEDIRFIEDEDTQVTSHDRVRIVS